MTHKLLKETYKTYEGARKRAAFENGIAGSEFRSGYKARLYHYTVVAESVSVNPTIANVWRVQRSEQVTP